MNSTQQNLVWNSGALDTQVNSVPGAPERVRSVSRAFEIFGYHARSAHDAIANVVDESDAGSEKSLMFVFGLSEAPGEVYSARLKGEAHLVAALHTVRNIGDLFAALANEVLLSRKIPVHRCDFKSVIPLLVGHKALYSQLTTIDADAFYQYVLGFDNTSKHRYLLPNVPTVSFAESRVGVQIGEFEYNGTRHASRWSRDVLQDAFVLRNEFVKAAVHLNEACGVPAP